MINLSKRVGIATNIKSDLGRKSGRRRIVQFIFIFYWLLVFEGALRKWGVPQLEQVFFFIRVPVAFILYMIVLRYRRWPSMNTPLLWGYVFAVLSAILVLVQIILGGYEPRYVLLAGYGWENYFLYIPLAFVIAREFRARDIRRLLVHTVWMLAMATPVIVLQFFSPPFSVINLGSGLDEATQFKNLGSALGYVRPTGFFTSSIGQTFFVASAFAMLLGAFLHQRKAPYLGPVALSFGFASIGIMTALSQSRTLFLMLGLILLAAIFASLLVGKARVVFRAAIWPTILALLALALWPLLFPDAFDAFTSRWVVASYIENRIFQLGMVGRALFGFYGFAYHLSDTPSFGYLLGLGGNAANQLSWVHMPQAAIEWQGYGAWAEDGWSRHIIELGPALGISFIIFRVFLTVWLGMKAAIATKRSGNVVPFILFGFVGLVILNGQITGHGTIDGYAWMFFGICLASARISISNVDDANALSRNSTGVGRRAT